MEGPVIAIAETQLKFGVDGNVADNATGKALGKWTTVSGPGDNKVRYDLGGKAQTPLAAKYTLGADLDVFNQLGMQLSTADGSAKSDTFSLVGGIEVDQDHKLNYFLVDNTGARTGVSITLYGDLNFSQENNDLVITLTGGGTLAIQGLGAGELNQFLTTDKNRFADFKGADLLEFATLTNNTIAGADDALSVPAVIRFFGNWHIQDGTLVFLSNIQTSAAGEQVALAFAGQLKAVTLGFAYFSGDGNTDLALNISGKHVFKSGADVTWSSSIGFSGKSFDATVDVTAHIPVGSNNKLSLDGHLNLKNADGSASTGPPLELSLDAEYDFDEHNLLAFKAIVDENGPTPSYDLRLTGTFQYSNLKLSFSVDLTDKTGGEIKVSVGIQGNDQSMIQSLSLVLDIKPDKVELDLSFSARVKFVDGQRVVDKAPTPAISAAAAAAPGTGAAASAADGQKTSG